STCSAVGSNRACRTCSPSPSRPGPRLRAQAGAAPPARGKGQGGAALARPPELMLASIPEFTRQADHLLRAPDRLDWSTVTLLGLVVYVYAVEVERAN